MTNPTETGARTERDDLIEIHDTQRGLFLMTTQGLSDEQARLTPTVSALSIGGLVKHVAATTVGWHDFISGQQSDAGGEDTDWGSASEESVAAFLAGFQLQPDETLAGALETYDQVHARTLELIRTVDLDEAHELPPAPWFPPGARWSNRRVLTHLVAETAQHAGHADIIRETIDGQKTMG